MKTSASLLVLALTVAAGAYVHRLMENNQAAPERETAFTQPDPTPAAESTMAAKVADELLASWRDSNVQVRDEILSALTAQEFPALATEMLRQRKYLGEIVEYWALADAQGLLVFAEKHTPNDLRTVVEHCFASEPVLVLAMI